MGNCLTLTKSNGHSGRAGDRKWNDPRYARLPNDPENKTLKIYPKNMMVPNTTVRGWDLIKSEVQEMTDTIVSSSFGKHSLLTNRLISCNL